MNSISATGQMQPMQPPRRTEQALTSDQKDNVKSILEQFSADNLTADDANSIVSSFADLGITPSKELEQLMSDSGFDAKSIGDMANVKNNQMPPPPPPQQTVSNSNEMVSFLEDLLKNFDQQLTDDDKNSILSAVQEKFGTNQNNSIIDVSA